MHVDRRHSCIGKTATAWPLAVTATVLAGGVPRTRAAAAAAAAPRRLAGDDGRASRDRVTIKMPADGAYLSVLRTATAGLAARLDFTLDEIEDLRIAVDEACAMLLSQAVPGTDLACDFDARPGRHDASPCRSDRLAGPGTRRRHVRLDRAHRPGRKRGRPVGPGDVLTIVLRKSRDSSRSV